MVEVTAAGGANTTVEVIVSIVTRIQFSLLIVEIILSNAGSFMRQLLIMLI